MPSFSPLRGSRTQKHQRLESDDESDSYYTPESANTPARYSSSTLATRVADNPRRHDDRDLNRTPSPTPSEEQELAKGFFDWKAMASRKFWFKKEYLWYYVLLVVILILVALMSIYHKQIVGWLTPFTQRLRHIRFGWLVPIGILFVISFPPLFGQEIVAIMCGLVWGPWIGFAIVSVGSYLGEVGNFFAFKSLCKARQEKLQRTNFSYACLSRVIRDGGFKVALIARFSAIPGHFTTAVFASCGMGFMVFTAAALLSMPKQFTHVFTGVLLGSTGSGESKKSKILVDVALGATFLITIIAMVYIWYEMYKVKPQVIYERRKARQAKLAGSGGSLYMNSGSTMASTDVFNPDDMHSAIPLAKTGPNEYLYQHWDHNGPDTSIHAPQPQTGAPKFLKNDVLPRDIEEGSGTPGYREDSMNAVQWDLRRPSPSPQSFDNSQVERTPTQTRFSNSPFDRTPAGSGYLMGPGGKFTSSPVDTHPTETQHYPPSLYK